MKFKHCLKDAEQIIDIKVILFALVLIVLALAGCAVVAKAGSPCIFHGGRRPSHILPAQYGRDARSISPVHFV